MTKTEDDDFVKMVEATKRGALVKDILAACQQDDYRALFMPEVTDLRITTPKSSAKQTVWSGWYLITPSVRVMGKTKQGTSVAVYAHCPNYFSDPTNMNFVTHSNQVQYLEEDIDEETFEREFQRLVDLEDNQTVFVVDYETLRKAPSDCSLSIRDALDHPQTIPFFGGKKRAKKYLRKYGEILDRDSIYIPNQEFEPLDTWAGNRVELLSYRHDPGEIGLYHSAPSHGSHMALAVASKRPNMLPEAQQESGTLASALEKVISRIF